MRDLFQTGGIAAAIALPCVALFFGIGIPTGAEVFFSHDVTGSDLWHLHYPAKHFYAQTLKAGHLPLWCPEMGTGFPLHAEGQVGALYPLNLFLFSLLPFALAFNWGVLLHTVLSVGFGAMLARQFGANRPGSILSGIVLAFSGFFITHLKHINIVASAIWICPMLLAVDRYAKQRRAATLMVLAGIIGLMILAGHPQIAYFNILVTGLYAAILLVRLWRASPGDDGGKRSAAFFAGGLVYSLVLGVLTGGAQLLPTQELRAWSPRQEGLTIEEATRWEYRPEHLITLVFPKWFGDPAHLAAEPAIDGLTGQKVESRGEPLLRLNGFESGGEHAALFWEITGYVGLLPLFLAGCSVFLGFAERNVRAMIMLLVVTMLAALGSSGGLFYLLYHVLPGFKLFRFQSRFLLHVDLVLALMAGLGLTLVMRRMAVHKPLVQGVLAGMAVFISLADLVVALGNQNPTVQASRISVPPPAAARMLQEEQAHIPRARMLETDTQRRTFLNAYFRARGWDNDLASYGPALSMLHPNLNALHGIPSIRIYSQLYPLWMGEVQAAIFRSTVGQDAGRVQIDSKAASLFNVRYLIDASGRLSRERRFPLIDEYEGDVWLRVPYLFEEGAYRVRLHRNTKWLPRAFLVPRARWIDGPEEAIGERMFRVMAHSSFDPRRQVLVAGKPDRSAADGEGDARPISAPVTFDAYDTQRIRMQVSAPHDCWLFLSDTYYPGWKATIDGKPTTIHRANIGGRAVRVPAGPHEVAFEYSPRSFTMGIVLSLVGVTLIVTLPAQARFLVR